jgi:hypothetical protein
MPSSPCTTGGGDGQNAQPRFQLGFAFSKQEDRNREIQIILKSRGMSAHDICREKTWGPAEFIQFILDGGVEETAVKESRFGPLLSSMA